MPRCCVLYDILCFYDSRRHDAPYWCCTLMHIAVLGKYHARKIVVETDKQELCHNVVRSALHKPRDIADSLYEILTVCHACIKNVARFLHRRLLAYVLQDRFGIMIA